MNLDVTIRFEDMAPSEALALDIRRHADKLLQFAPRLQSCDVAVRHDAHRHTHGNRYVARIHAVMPGGTFEAGRPSLDRSHEDAYIAVRDAFEALRRQLEDHMRIRRGEVKRHRVQDAAPND